MSYVYGSETQLFGPSENCTVCMVDAAKEKDFAPPPKNECCGDYGDVVESFRGRRGRRGRWRRRHGYYGRYHWPGYYPYYYNQRPIVIQSPKAEPVKETSQASVVALVALAIGVFALVSKK